MRPSGVEATGLPRRRAITRSARHLQERRRERMADRDGECIGSMVRRRPRAVADGPEAPAAYMDDPVPAIRRPWIDADDLHADTLGTRSDNSSSDVRRLPRWGSLRPDG